MKRLMILTLWISILFSMTAFASNYAWQQDENGWKYVDTDRDKPFLYGTVVDTGSNTFPFVRVDFSHTSTPFESGINIVATYFIKDGYMVTNAWMPFLESDGSGSWRYYGSDGKALTNTITPDGYTVDAQGFWIENGVKVRDAAALEQFMQGAYGRGGAMIATKNPPQNGPSKPNQSTTNNSSGSATNGASDSLKSMIVSCKASREQILNQLNAEGIPYEYNAKGALFFNDVGGFKYSLQFNEQDICNFSMYLTLVNSLENAVGLYKYSEKIYGNDSNFTEISSGFWGNALLSKVYHDRRGNYIILSVNEANGQYEFATSYAASL